MKVGDYVRISNGQIAKITKIKEYKKWLNIIYTDNIIDMHEDRCCNENFIDEEDIIKSSPNIIDLFEEQDLVVIEYYSLRYEERVTRLFEVTFKNGEYINLSNAKCDFLLANGKFNKGDKELKPIIKSIVTHEQFESIEYRIGE